MKNFIDNIRFEQRMFVKNFYSNDVCSWLLKEVLDYTEKNGWEKTRHTSYPTTDIEINKIPHVFSFIMNSFYNRIWLKISEYYNLNEQYRMHIFDGFFVKYKYNEQNHLEFHKDDSILTFTILLNSKDEFKGGGVKFMDDIIINADMGDLLIHSGEETHCALPIENGERYVLVCFLK
jgi:hypothetical protein